MTPPERREGKRDQGAAAVVRRRAGLGWPALAFAGAALAVTYVAMVDPNEQGHYPACPFLAVTGYYCPGCGSLRMLHAAAHGHLGEAAGRNALAFALLPLLGFLWARWAAAAARGRPVGSLPVRPWMIWAFTALILVFWLVRNLPAGRALAP
jgi:hypothetical protein